MFGSKQAATARCFREEDVSPEALERLRTGTIAVVGFGNQGRAQACNLRDSGFRVLIGNIADPYAEKARSDGFEALPIGEAVAQADLVMLLLPDEVAPRIFREDIAPRRKPGSTLSFASGYNVAFGGIACPDDADVILLAPRMVGTGVRELYQRGEGYYSFVAVEQDATGQAWQTLLALCHGVGTLRKGAVEVTFRMEAELDLFNEQAFGPAFGKVLLSAVDTLVAAGYPREVVLLEIFLSGELGHICKEMAETGIVAQLDQHSPTSQYGAISRGIQFLGCNLGRPMRRVLENIRSGAFAREWAFEQRTGQLRFRFLKAMAKQVAIGRLERRVRRDLGIDDQPDAA